MPPRLRQYCEGPDALLGGLFDGRDAACWSMRARAVEGHPPPPPVRLVGIDNSTYEVDDAQLRGFQRVVSGALGGLAAAGGAPARSQRAGAERARPAR